MNSEYIIYDILLVHYVGYSISTFYDILIVYFIPGLPITSATAFTLASVLNAFQFSLGTLPFMLRSLAEAVVAIQRVQVCDYFFANTRTLSHTICQLFECYTLFTNIGAWLHIINSISGATAAKSYEGNYSEDYDS